MLRVILALTLVCTSLLAGVPPVQAGYEWCSVDPVLTFTREDMLSVRGLVSTRVVDVQVLVPLSALPVEGVAHLAAQTPSNVQGTELLNTSVPLLFTLQTSFAAQKPATSTSPYEIDLALVVPGDKQSFPVRLLVTNLSTGEITLSEGMAGKALRQTIALR